MRTRRSQSSSDPASPQGHTPVLLHEVLEALAIAQGDCVVDATLGGAGHARAIAERLGEEGVFIGFDMDADAIDRAKSALEGGKPRVELVNANFRTMQKSLAEKGITSITKALFDLGWSSYQLDSGRGFSFQKDEPLVMTYAKSGSLTARTIVNDWAEASLADVTYGWGQERYARRIAKAIVDARVSRPIETAKELADIVSRAVPARARFGQIHPATKTFQALRIAANDELGALSEGLRAAWELLAPGGRIAVISFHSLEDAIVKRMFVEWERVGEGKRLTRKPVIAGEAELEINPRARSAKLRVIERSDSFSTYGKNDQTHTHQQI